MSVEVDPNQGPLTLHYDTSPRDITKGPAPPQLWQDFRFKGFPDKSMQAPKVPKYKRMSLDLMNQDDQYFGKTTHFDTGRLSPRTRRSFDFPAKKNNRALLWRPNEYKPHNLLKRKSGRVSKSDIVSIKSQKRLASKFLIGTSRATSIQNLHAKSAKERASPSIVLESRATTVNSPVRTQNQRPEPSERENPYTVRDPLGNLSERRYVVRDPFGDYTEEHKFKLQKEMRDIEEDKKQRDIIEKIRSEEREEERRKDKEMLTHYYPWGRPGGGAPTVDNRKQKFLETDIEGSPQSPRYRETMLTRSLTAEELDSLAKRRRQKELMSSLNTHTKRPSYHSIVDFLGSPGGGAPLRTRSGNIKTSLIGDLMIRFQDRNRDSVNERFRYNQDRGEQERYGQDLAQQRNEEELRRQEDRLENLQRELETMKSDNYGKPGGGAPNRTSSESFTERQQKIGGTPSTIKSNSPRKGSKISSAATSKTSITTISSRSGGTSISTRSKDDWDPWGRGIGNPDRDHDGKVKPRPLALEKQKLKSNYNGPFVHRTTKANDPNKVNVKGTDNKPLVTNINRDVRVPTGRYSPWGKGFGHPERDRDGNVKGRKNTLDKNKPQDIVDTSPRTKKQTQPTQINREKMNSPVVGIGRDNRINWSDNSDSPRWGQGLGNPQRTESGRVLPRQSLLEKKKDNIPNREGTPNTNINRDTRIPQRSNSPWDMFGKGAGNPQWDSQGNVVTKKSMSLDKKKPIDNVGPSTEKKQKAAYDPSQGLLQSPRRNQTPEIKLHSTRNVPSLDGDYDPWNKGFGNPQRNEFGNVHGKKATLNSNKPIDKVKGPRRAYEPSSLMYSSDVNTSVNPEEQTMGGSENRERSAFGFGRGAGNPQRGPDGNVLPKINSLDSNKPIDGPSEEKKRKPYDPTAGGKVNSPRRNQTPDIKLNLDRPLPKSDMDYVPWGTGVPPRDEDGYIQGRNQSLDAARPVDNAEKTKKPIFDPSAGNPPSARGNITPEIKLHMNRPLPSNTGEYNPWGKGFGNTPDNPSRKISTLDSTRPPDGMSDGTGEPIRRPKPFSDLSAMFNRDMPQKKTTEPETNINRDTRIPSGKVGLTFGQGAGNPVYDENGNVMRHTTTLDVESKEHPGGSDSPRRAPPTTRYDPNFGDLGRSMPYADRLTKMNREVLPLYHPFGRAGGGAPLKDHQGKIVTQIQGNLKMENTMDDKQRKQARAREYYDFLRGQEEEQRKNKQEIEYHMKAPIGELATIMGSKNVGKPMKDPYTGEYRNHHLGNSDVTLQKMNYQPKAITEKKKYHEDLSMLADERMRHRQLNRLKDNQEGMLHHHTMDAMWGRPGGGAPKGYNLRKFNLESTLNHPTKDQTTEEYIKKKDWSQINPEGGPFGTTNSYSPRFQPNKYIRSTVTSNHVNLYEYPEQHKDKNYALTEPYATM